MTRLLTMIRRLRHRGIDVPRSLWYAPGHCRVPGRLP